MLIPLWEKAKAGRGIYFFLKAILRCGSFLFGLGLLLRRIAYSLKARKKIRLKARVISIGNITLGGTGKTPLVEYLGRKMKERNKKAAILSRGYGRRVRTPLIIAEKISWQDAGDEAVLLSRNLKDIPILVGKNRAESGKEAMDKLGAEIILLDDGFQHWPLQRDLDVVTLDYTRPIWENSLFPLGDLRERVNSLKRAQVFVLTRVDNTGSSLNIWQDYLRDINPEASIFLTCHEPAGFISKKGRVFPLSIVRGKKLTAFSGIANPEAFEETLKTLGGRLLYSLRYPDHYEYGSTDLKEIEMIAQQSEAIITTEKDLVRIEGGPGEDRLLALRVEIKFLKDEDIFLNKVLWYGISKRNPNH
jgi:tetraacyldisaccharide 4'-kinase